MHPVMDITETDEHEAECVQTQMCMDTNSFVSYVHVHSWSFIDPLHLECLFQEGAGSDGRT